MSFAFVCFHCGTPLTFASLPGRSEVCEKCGYDVRVCLNCRHYDGASYNECREPVAERIVDKDRRNFCDYFSPGGTGQKVQGATKDEMLKKLDDLFKK